MWMQTGKHSTADTLLCCTEEVMVQLVGGWVPGSLSLLHTRWLSTKRIPYCCTAVQLYSHKWQTEPEGRKGLQQKILFLEALIYFQCVIYLTGHREKKKKQRAEKQIIWPLSFSGHGLDDCCTAVVGEALRGREVEEVSRMSDAATHC